jgi:hypothetical protein
MTSTASLFVSALMRERNLLENQQNEDDDEETP